MSVIPTRELFENEIRVHLLESLTTESLTNCSMVSCCAHFACFSTSTCLSRREKSWRKISLPLSLSLRRASHRGSGSVRSTRAPNLLRTRRVGARETTVPSCELNPYIYRRFRHAHASNVSSTSVTTECIWMNKELEGIRLTRRRSEYS